MSMLTNDKITYEEIKENFVSINTLFYRLFNKKEVIQLLNIFKIYDLNNNKNNTYISNFLELVGEWFKVKINQYEPDDDSESKKEFDVNDVNYILNINFEKATMYVFFIHLLKSNITQSIKETSLKNNYNSVSVSEDFLKTVGKIYKEDFDVFTIMIGFFKNYYIEEIFFNDEFAFSQYRENFKLTVDSIIEMIVSESQCDSLLDVINSTGKRMQENLPTLYGTGFGEIFLNIKTDIYKKKQLFNGDAAKEMVSEILKQAQEKINNTMAEVKYSKQIANYNESVEEGNKKELKSLFEKMNTDKEELKKALKTISNYTQKIMFDDARTDNKFFTNFDNFFKNFLQCISTGQQLYLDNMEDIMKEEIDELSVPYTFYYKTIWYIIAIWGASFSSTELKKSKNFINSIKDYNWEVEIKNKSGNEIFKDKFWKYFAVYPNYINEGYSEYNGVLKDKGFLNMQKMAVEASKILSKADSKEIENIKKEIHKIFYEKIDFGIYTLQGGLYGATQNIADLVYELCTPIELTFNKNIAASFFEEIKNASVMCVKGAAIEAIYTLCFTKFDFLGNCSLFDLINKLRYYNEILKNASTLKLENDNIVKSNIIMQSEEYINKVKDGFGVFNNDPEIKNNCFWFVYTYIKNRNFLFGYDFKSTNSDWWREQISNLNEKESSFIFLAYTSFFAKKSFDPSNFLQSYNKCVGENLELDDISKKTYSNINSFFGLKGYSSSEYKKLGAEFINKGVYKAVFGIEHFNDFYSLEINENNRDNFMPLSFVKFSNRCESEFSYFFIEISELEKAFVEQKKSSLKDDQSVFLMRFAPTIQMLLKNIPGFSSIINLDFIISKFDESINSILLFVNDSLNKMTNDLTDIQDKYTLELMNKKYYYMVQAVPVAIDYIYKIIVSSNFSFATLVKQMEKSTIDFEDIEELSKIQKTIDEHLDELQKNSTNSNIVVRNVAEINLEDYNAVKEMINDLSVFDVLYAENNTIVVSKTSPELNLNLNKTSPELNLKLNKTLTIDSEYATKIFIEAIKQYVNITEKQINILNDVDKINNFIYEKITKQESAEKKLQSYTVTKINIPDLQKSIKDVYIKKQISGTKNIIQLSDETKQEKINLRFDLYK